MDEARFHELLGRYHDGTSTPADEAELEAALRADPDCRRTFVERDLMEVQLRKSYAGSLVGKSPAAPRTRRRRVGGPSGPKWGGAAIAAAALFAAALLYALSSSSPPPVPRKPEVVRTVPNAPAAEEAFQRAREDRRQAEERLDRIERERSKADADRRAAKQEEARREAELAVARADAEKLDAQARLVRAQEEERMAKVEVYRAQVTPTTEPRPAVESRIASATVQAVEGGATMVEGTVTRPLAAGDPILAGQGVRSTALLRLVFPDGTQLTLEGATELASVLGKRLTVQKGTVQAQVTKQPVGQPLIFASAQGEAKVLGTTLKFLVDETSSRLDVKEGRVQLKRLADGRTVDVITGHFAVIGPGAEFVSRPLPITDIPLTAALGQLTGDDWRAVKDPDATAGVLLEAVSSPNFAVATLPIDVAKINAWFAKQRSRSFVTFTFTADADTDYWVWIRGRCTAPAGQGRLRADDVMLEVGDATFVRRPADWQPYADFLCTFIGFGAHQGFWWSGGGHDPNSTQTPIALRFKRPGRQVIRLHALETPLQIDTIWLSTTKTTRPGPEEAPGKR